MPYLEVTIPADLDKQEILTALLSEEGYDSFLETENKLVAYIEEELFNVNELNITLQQLAITEKITTKKLEDKNWNEEWEKNYDPVFVNDKVQIRAEFHPSQNFEYEILITPKMSFGTGHHATTSLVISSQLEIDHSDKKVLDAGCGTGVLSIMAEKRGAKEVIAYDCDEWAYKNSKENFEKNNCSKTSIFLLDSAEKLNSEENFDIILANINKNVLLHEIPAFSKRLSLGGTLVMSGFFIKDVEDIQKVAEDNGLLFLKSTDNGQWATVQLTK